MGDLYFNELSVDPEIVKLPESFEQAKQIVKEFIFTFIAYKCASGVEQVYCLSESYNRLQNLLDEPHQLFELIDKIEAEGDIDEFQKQLFKSAIAETFSNEPMPEYQWNGKEAYGLGKAYEENTYSISCNNKLIGGAKEWPSTIELKKETIQNDQLVSENVTARNLISSKQVFFDFEVWKGCEFKNNRPSKQLLPKRILSESIIKAFDYESWTKYYQVQQKESDVTQKNSIATIVAKINGWEKSDECPGQGRLLFNTKNYYLAVDTQHATFEVYSSNDTHEGEIHFNSNEINKDKKDKERGICGKNTDK